MNRPAPAALLAATVLAFAAWPLSAEQAAKPVTVGLLFTGNVPREQDAFFDQMREFGYAEGVNVTYIRRRGTFDSAPAAATELVAARPDIIVTSANSNVRALKDATSTIPIVFAVAGDVELGLVASLAHPGGNLTGLSYQNGDLLGKRLQLLREAFPTLRKIGVFYDPADGAGYRRAIEKIAAGLGFELSAVDVPDGGAIDGAFAAVTAANAGAVFVTGGRVMTPNADKFVALASKYRLPTMCHQDTLTRAGCLMSYGPSFPAMFQRAAVLVDRILKGAKPADLPVEQPTKFEFVINLQSAKALGLTIPQAVIARADEVIE